MALTTITSGGLGDNSVDSDAYVDGSIDLAHLSADSVDSTQYVDGSIDNAHLADDAVDSDELAAGSVDAAHLASGVGGTTHASQWRITSNHTGAGFLTANWAVAGVSGPGTLGSGMTESSGVFEFPSTGFWLIDFVVLCSDHDINRYIGTNIFITNDGGSTFTEVTKAYNNIYYDSGDAYWCSASTKYLFEVDVLANDKIKFHAHAADAAAEHQGHADMNQTYVTFIRLGDT